MCKNKDELNKLVEKRRKLTSEKEKIEEKLKEVNNDIIEYVLAKGIAGGKDNKTLIVIGDGYEMRKYAAIEKKLKITVYPRMLYKGKLIDPNEIEKD